MMRWRLPDRCSVVETMWAEVATATQMVPTGFEGVPPPGPAMPLVAMAISAPNFREAPLAIASATGIETAPLSAMREASTSSRLVLTSLE